MTNKSELSVAEESLVGLCGGMEGPAWLNNLRAAAKGHVESLGLPTTRDEAWKYTNLRGIRKSSFSLSEAGAGVWSADEINARVPEIGGHRLVFLDGRFQEGLSSVGELPKGVRLGSVAATLRDEPEVLDDLLGNYADAAEQFFVALNTSVFEDGALLMVPRNVVLEETVQLVFLSSKGLKDVLAAPRNLIVVGNNAQASLVEHHVGAEEASHLITTVSEVLLGDNANVKHARIIQGGSEDVHVTSSKLLQSRSSVYNSCTYWLSGAINRNNQDILLAAEGVECTVDGLYIVSGKEHTDNRTVIDHAKPHGDSFQLCKGILLDQGRGVFQGKVIVARDAQKTNANQSNPNLLLSEKAVADTRPQLEIYADDVRCTHGATVGGELDKEGLFYLNSRGVPQDEARKIMTVAFAHELVEKESNETLAAFLHDAIVAKITG